MQSVILGRKFILNSYFLLRPFLSNSLLIKMDNKNYSNNAGKIYDLIVIGGGSGGLACAKEAALFGKEVAVLDFVVPSPQGTSWGLGGTCVNVGCIPKKLMHNVAQMKDVLQGAEAAGWTGVTVNRGKLKVDWPTMSMRIQNYVKSLNWGHRVALRENNVTYVNAKASFIDSNTIKAVDKKGEATEMKAKHFVIAVGGRPKYPDIPGAKEYGITSDDLFWLRDGPGKTLVVGASYVALECAGFLHEFGYDTTIMMRSIPLRGFDRQMSDSVLEYMENGIHIPVLKECVPTKVEKMVTKKYRVTWTNKKNESLSDTFDTVLFAIGRKCCTEDLNLKAAGVLYNEQDGKIISMATRHQKNNAAGGGGGGGSTKSDASKKQGNKFEKELTSATNIYAIGDVLEGGVELTPVAIKAGKMLANRLFNSNAKDMLMDYDKIATCVFTPLEYGCVGMTEEDAKSKFEHIEVYHCHYKPLEWYGWGLENKGSGADGWKGCYMKMICDAKKHEKVVGLHILGPNAGEIVQGFAVSVRAGVTRKQICQNTVGIHPTTAEEVVKLHITKSSGKDPRLTGC